MVSDVADNPFEPPATSEVLRKVRLNITQWLAIVFCAVAATTMTFICSVGLLMTIFAEAILTDVLGMTKDVDTQIAIAVSVFLAVMVGRLVGRGMYLDLAKQADRSDKDGHNSQPNAVLTLLKNPNAN